MSQPKTTARREFLKFLAASPYVASLGGIPAFLRRGILAQSAQETSDVIAKPADALNVFDFEEAAHRKVNQATGLICRAVWTTVSRWLTKHAAEIRIFWLPS